MGSAGLTTLCVVQTAAVAADTAASAAAAAVQALAGTVDGGKAGLRYKKKMMLWGDTEVGYCMMTFVIR
jgi:opacity protein-like surface antigen